MEEELVDILVTTYNTNEKYLRKQINSLLRQSHKNLKIYISDDNSQDENVIKILKEYEEKDNRIKLFLQQTNLGYNKNFEFLLKKSKANYIMFCDHDDIWHLDKVQKSLDKIKQENVDMVYCNCRQIDEDGLVIKESYFKLLQELNYFKNSIHFTLIIDKQTLSKCSIISWLVNDSI